MELCIAHILVSFVDSWQNEDEIKEYWNLAVPGISLYFKLK